MKIILRTAAIAVVLRTTYCRKDTANAITDIFDEEVEQIENAVLALENVTDTVIIDGNTLIISHEGSDYINTFHFEK